jgi:hypothetical protein
LIRAYTGPKLEVGDEDDGAAGADSGPKSLNTLGVGHGDEIACMGTIACLNDPYWMRLGESNLYALPLSIPEPATLPWDMTGAAKL